MSGTPLTSSSTTPQPSVDPTAPAHPINNLLAPFPLTDMTAYDRYKGEDGGLYGNGLNVPPPAQYSSALAELAKIMPLDASGNPSANGKIGFISIGMSNTTMEFSVFKKMADADPAKSSSVSIVDGAQGGQTAKIWATLSSPWQVLPNGCRLPELPRPRCRWPG